MGADSLAENTQMPIIYLPNLSAQAQKFWISMKKGLHWESTVHDCSCLAGDRLAYLKKITFKQKIDSFLTFRLINFLVQTPICAEN